MNDTDIFLSIFTDNYLDDSRCLIELAMSIVLDKPMFLLIQKGTRLNQHFSRLIDGYEYYDKNNEESLKRGTINLNNKIEKFLKK